MYLYKYYNLKSSDKPTRESFLSLQPSEFHLVSHWGLKDHPSYSWCAPFAACTPNSSQAFSRGNQQTSAQRDTTATDKALCALIRCEPTVSSLGWDSPTSKCQSLTGGIVRHTSPPTTWVQGSRLHRRVVSMRDECGTPRASIQRMEAILDIPLCRSKSPFHTS